MERIRIPLYGSAMEISDSHVLVTGANRSLGRALVEAALRNGAGRVYAAVRDATSLAQFNRDPRLMPLEFDVTEARADGCPAESIGSTC